MFVARRGCPKEERRGCSSSAVCSGPRGCAGSVFCVFDAAARSAPARAARQSNLCPAQSNLELAEKLQKPNPTRGGVNFASIVVVLTRGVLCRSERSFSPDGP